MFIQKKMIEYGLRTNSCKSRQMGNDRAVSFLPSFYLASQSESMPTLRNIEVPFRRCTVAHVLERTLRFAVVEVIRI